MFIISFIFRWKIIIPTEDPFKRIVIVYFVGPVHRYPVPVRLRTNKHIIRIINASEQRSVF